ncbi:MAG: hypothetical protein ACKOC6_00975 [bacterium]
MSIPRYLVPVGLALLFASTALAATTVFSGTPETGVVSSMQDTKRVVLSSKDRTRYKCIIEKEGDDYYWVSRDRRLMAHTTSGPHHYFFAVVGAGFVKVMDTSALSSGTPIGFLYIEVLTLGLDSYSYWGQGSSFRP